MLVVVPDPASPDLARTLDLAGYSWKAVAAGSAVSEHEPQGGWAGAIVDATTDPGGRLVVPAGDAQARRRVDAR